MDARWHWSACQNESNVWKSQRHKCRSLCEISKYTLRFGGKLRFLSEVRNEQERSRSKNIISGPALAISQDCCSQFEQRQSVPQKTPNVLRMCIYKTSLPTGFWVVTHEFSANASTLRVRRNDIYPWNEARTCAFTAPRSATLKGPFSGVSVRAVQSIIHNSTRSICSCISNSESCSRLVL